VDKSGRRPSKLLLIAKLRKAVDKWRTEGFPGASEVTLRLFGYWFEEDHEVEGFAVPFRFHFCQRKRVSKQTGQVWRFHRVAQAEFERAKWSWA